MNSEPNPQRTFHASTLRDYLVAYLSGQYELTSMIDPDFSKEYDFDSPIHMMFYNDKLKVVVTEYEFYTQVRIHNVELQKFLLLSNIKNIYIPNDCSKVFYAINTFNNRVYANSILQSLEDSSSLLSGDSDMINEMFM